MDSMDRAAMHKEMIRRQVFTAISFAVAMTLPKIAPRIFKIHLAQVLRIPILLEEFDGVRHCIDSIKRKAFQGPGVE